ncbi:MAG TPA: ABC transporter ATP-binding protein [Bacillota bacterium]|jgi:ABC-2 type transport system ATP-binding protein
MVQAEDLSGPAKAIETNLLTRTYGSNQAVADLNLVVPKGSVFGFLGPNGAGKTTTIKMLLGLLKPTSGGAKVLGYDLGAENIKARARIGYVPENTEIYGYMRVREMIAFTQGLFPRWDTAVVARYLKLFGLPEDRLVKALSKGMRAQLALVLALGPRPELLILDEPTSGMDPLARKQFLSSVLQEVSAAGQTVFMSSHILADVERVADHIALLNRGRLVLADTMDHLKTNNKKIRVVPSGDAPSDLERWPGVRSVIREGRGLLISVEDGFDAIAERLKSASPTYLEVIDMNLEEIFIDYAGGERLALA